MRAFRDERCLSEVTPPTGRPLAAPLDVAIGTDVSTITQLHQHWSTRGYDVAVLEGELAPGLVGWVSFVTLHHQWRKDARPRPMELHVTLSAPIPFGPRTAFGVRCLVAHGGLLGGFRDGPDGAQRVQLLFGDDRVPFVNVRVDGSSRRSKLTVLLDRQIPEAEPTLRLDAGFVDRFSGLSDDPEIQIYDGQVAARLSVTGALGPQVLPDAVAVLTELLERVRVDR